MANVGKGAASGAAIGSAISPGLGTVIGGIGGAAISAIGSFFGNKSNRKQSAEAFKRESKFAREERLAQQQWIEQMYEKNNSYNSPAAQMQRMKEAGLNPDLIRLLSYVAFAQQENCTSYSFHTFALSIVVAPNVLREQIYFHA